MVNHKTSAFFLFILLLFSACAEKKKEPVASTSGEAGFDSALSLLNKKEAAIQGNADSLLSINRQQLALLAAHAKWRMYIRLSQQTYYRLFDSGQYRQSLEITDSLLAKKEILQSNNDTLIRSYYLALFDAGFTAFTMEDFVNAEKYFNRLLIHYEGKWPDRLTATSTYEHLGKIYAILGDTKRSVFYLLKQYRLYEAGEKESRAVVAINLSPPLFEQGLYDSAIGILQHSAQDSGLSKKRLAYVCSELAGNYLASGNIEKATDCMQRATFFSGQLGDDADSKKRRYNIKRVNAMLLLQQRQYVFATRLLKEAESLNREVYRNNRNRELGKIFLLQSSVMLHLGDPDSALYYADLALRSVCRVKQQGLMAMPARGEIVAENTLEEALDAKAAALEEKLRSGWDKALAENIAALYEMSFETEGMLLEYFSNDESRIQAMNAGKNRSEKAIAICYDLRKKTGETKWSEKAFMFSELSKSMVLFSKVREQIAANRELQSDSAFAELRLLKLKMAFLKEQENAGKENEQSAGQLEYLQQQYNITFSVLKAKYPLLNNWAGRQDIASVDQVKEYLPAAGTNLLEYFVGANSNFLFVVSKKEPVQLYRLEDSLHGPVNSFLFYFREQQHFINDVQGYCTTAYRLFKMLGLGMFDKSIQHLIIVPDDHLSFLPFDALVTSDAPFTGLENIPYLINDMQVDYSQSASLMITGRQQVPWSNMAVFAPVFGGPGSTQQALNSTKDEVASIKEEYPAGKFFLGKDAALKSFRQSAPAAGLIHIASHADAGIAGKGPVISFADSSLTLDELYASRLKAALVVLSACETGKGVLEPGEGVMSLARGFYYAGARNVIQSLWRVNDEATADIFKRFYRYYGRETFSRALYLAKKNSLAEQKNLVMRSPYFWAGFVFAGDTRAGSRQFPSAGLVSLVLILLGLLQIISFFIRNRKSGF